LKNIFASKEVLYTLGGKGSNKKPTRGYDTWSNNGKEIQLFFCLTIQFYFRKIITTIYKSIKST